jgi:hypothetical protein
MLTGDLHPALNTLDLVQRHMLDPMSPALMNFLRLDWSRASMFH